MLDKDMIRVFWCHPRLRDYRKPLFKLVCKNYRVHFLFWYKGEPPDTFNYFYANKPFKGKVFGRLISLSDLNKMYEGIKSSDVFITSFLSNPFSKVGIIFAKVMKKKIIVWEEIAYFHTGILKKLK